MSSTNDDNQLPQIAVEVGSTVETPLQPPVAPFASGSSAAHDPVPSSTRTSFTRVDHDDEEHRPRPSTSHDPAPPVREVVPTPQNAATIANEETTVSIPAMSNPQDEAQPSSSAPPTAAQPPAEMAASPSQTVPVSAALEESVPQTPQIYLTFLLISGRRRTMAFEAETAVGRVKELVWNSWPGDWQDERPPAPSYLRVLYLGRMLQDDETLTKLKLSVSSSTSPTPTIMHLSIRPYAPPGEGDGMKKKRRRGGQDSDGSGNNEAGEQQDGAGCCNCIIC